MRGAKKFAIFAGVFLLVLIIAIILAAYFGVLLTTLYIFMMVFAALMILATIFQVYSVLALIRTITTVREETKPLLASVQDTIGIVQDTAKTAGRTVTTVGATANLASLFVLGPSVRAAAALVAGQQMLRIFMGQGHVRTRHQERSKQQREAAARGGE